MVRSCLKNSFHWDSWYVCLFLSMTQQKRKLRIYISNTYTPSKPDGEEAEKVSSWELRVEGKLLEEVSKQHSHYIWIFLLCSTITRVVWLPSISGSVIVFLHSHSALVGLCPWLWPSNQMCVYSSPPLHPTTPNTLAHKLMLSFETGNWNHWPLHTISCHASPPSINSLCHLGPHEEGFKKKKKISLFIFSLLPYWFRHAWEFCTELQKKKGMWGKEWKGSYCANTFWQGCGEGGGCNSFF